ncbi:MAG: 6-phosphogluconolactonase [Wenzhouxiangella sp.]
MQWTECPDRAALVDAVSQRIAVRLSAALEAGPEACIALAGGGTPMPIYARLAGLDLDWARVVAVATDERWVAADHPASNASRIRRQFAGTGLRVAGLVPEQAGGEASVEAAEQTLARLGDIFDLALVGMGGDGHFASLFPHAPALATGLDPEAIESALVVMPDPLPPEAPFARVTLTLARLLASRSLMLVITGEAKYKVLRQALQPDADPHKLPIAALLRSAGDRLEIFWSP